MPLTSTGNITPKRNAGTGAVIPPAPPAAPPAPPKRVKGQPDQADQLPSLNMQYPDPQITVPGFNVSVPQNIPLPGGMNISTPGYSIGTTGASIPIPLALRRAAQAAAYGAFGNPLTNASVQAGMQAATHGIGSNTPIDTPAFSMGMGPVSVSVPSYQINPLYKEKKRQVNLPSTTNTGTTARYDPNRGRGTNANYDPAYNDMRGRGTNINNGFMEIPQTVMPLAPSAPAYSPFASYYGYGGGGGGGYSYNNTPSWVQNLYNWNFKG